MKKIIIILCFLPVFGFGQTLFGGGGLTTLSPLSGNGRSEPLEFDVDWLFDTIQSSLTTLELIDVEYTPTNILGLSSGEVQPENIYLKTSGESKTVTGRFSSWRTNLPVTLTMPEGTFSEVLSAIVTYNESDISVTLGIEIVDNNTFIIDRGVSLLNTSLSFTIEGK